MLQLATTWGTSSFVLIDVAACGNPFFCTTSEALPVGMGLPRQDPSLAYSPVSDQIYMIGRQSGNRILYDTLDATALALDLPAAAPTTGIDGYTAGGLSAIPIPEPTSRMALTSGIAMLLWLGRRRSRR
jgi:hypothetical protein